MDTNCGSPSPGWKFHGKSPALETSRVYMTYIMEYIMEYIHLDRILTGEFYIKHGHIQKPAMKSQTLSNG